MPVPVILFLFLEAAMEPKRDFSATEVGTLLESVDKKIDFITETVIPLREDMADVKTLLTSLGIDVRSIKDVIRIEIPSMRSRIARLETKS